MPTKHFLRTAQQPQSLRRLAALIGYNPRPGVAALAELAFYSRPRQDDSGAGRASCASAPAQNQQPQTFETLEAATVDWRFNNLRIYPQPTTANPWPLESTEIILDRLNGPAIAAGLTADDTVVLFNDAGTDQVEEKKDRRD